MDRWRWGSSFARVGPRRSSRHSTPPPPQVAGRSNLYLSAAADTRPSSYIGRWFADRTLAQGRAGIDEASAELLPCTKYISAVEEAGADTTLTDFASASASGATRLMVVGAAAARAGFATASTAKLQYRVVSKWRAHVNDPDALMQCCREASDRCGAAYISEFLVGTGQADVCAMDTGSISAGIDFVGIEAARKQGRCQSVTFAKPVAFAFRLTPLSSRCGAVDIAASRLGVAPSSSDWMPTERSALEFVQTDARRRQGEGKLVFCQESRPMGASGSQYRAKAVVLTESQPASTVAGWVLSGTGAAAIVAGGALLLLARGRASDADQARTPQALGEAQDDATNIERAGFGLLAGGAVVGGVGAFLLLRTPSDGSQMLNAPTPLGAGLMWRGSWP